MDSDSYIEIAAILILICLSAFFSASETALSMANRVRLKTLADEGNKKAKTALSILEDYGKMLSAILIGNNIVNISLSALVTVLAIKIDLAVGIATACLTVIILIFGEILPKSISAIKAEKFTLHIAGIIKCVIFVLTPVIFIVDLISKGILKLLRIDANAKEAMTEGELRTYVDVSHEDGVIEEEEKNMIINVFDFGDSVAKDIMIPRIDMITVEEAASFDEIMDIFREYMYTRIPVYSGENDNIIGIINIKDIIHLKNKDDFNLKKIMRQAYFTFEYTKTADLLNDMRLRSEAMAFVLNEYGSCVGMVTLEDLLEEIVGEIRDEYDKDEENLIQKMEENTYLIEGSMKLDDVNDELGTDLESEDYDSIGGLVMEYLEDRLPAEGEKITTKEGVELSVHKVSQNRILKVILKLMPKTDDPTEE